MSYQREYDRRLRVGIVGVGSHAYRNILPALHHLPVRLVALCDRDGELARRTAEEYGIPAFAEAGEMYSTTELDAVLLCAGPRAHPKLAIQALGRGLAVWMEKPPGMFAADVEQILAAAGDRTVGVGFKKAYMPAIRKAKELVALPEFGELRSILAVYPMTIAQDGAGVLERAEFTNWLANGCHPLSALVELGGRVRSVRTLRGPGSDAVGSVQLEFASGCAGTFFLAGGAPAGAGVERYELFGAGRSIAIEDSARVVYHRGVPFDYSYQRDFTGPGTDTGSVVWQAEHRLATLENTGLFVQGMFDELFEFCTAVLEHRPVRSGGLPDALHIMRIYEAALRSTGEPVEIEGVAP
ncbi:MAG TPA: Gfo/Idh/MocA family oxidoreductase [Mycobacteriales bacterium]|nr:Gfo/Idh/MocA family oxidoreductase [Mycobacteriales bacterium]